ncbi:hypothetical protein ACFE04_026792 [Oxalis oulophora]
MSTNEEKNIGVVVDGHHDYSQTAAGYAVDERPLPCFGIGIGWLLFIVGLFLSAIPWYVGFLLLLFGRMDNREKAGLIACTFSAIFCTIVIILVLIKGPAVWQSHNISKEEQVASTQHGMRLTPTSDDEWMEVNEKKRPARSTAGKLNASNKSDFVYDGRKKERGQTPRYREFSDISQRAKSCQVHLEEIQRALENDRANIDLLGSELRSREHLDTTILSSGPMVNLDEEDGLHLFDLSVQLLLFYGGWDRFGWDVLCVSRIEGLICSISMDCACYAQ